MFFDALESHVVKKGLLGELHLRWTHRIWGEECALELDDKFAKGLAWSTTSETQRLQKLLPPGLTVRLQRDLSSSLEGCSRYFQALHSSYIFNLWKKKIKAAYPKAKALVPTKICLVFAVRWVCRSQRTMVHWEWWVTHVGGPGCTVWKRSRCSWSSTWPALLFPAWFRSRQTDLFFLFHIKRLGKPRELRRVFFLRGKPLVHHQIENALDNCRQ